VAVAGIGEDAAVGGLCELRGKILPHGDGAEAFVEHDDGGNIRRGRMQQSFEAFAVDYNVSIVLRNVGQPALPIWNRSSIPFFVMG